MRANGQTDAQTDRILRNMTRRLQLNILQQKGKYEIPKQRY